MKCFMIFLAISLTASEKLDRAYLPPPGAQFAGGNPGDIQAPFEVPNISQPGNIPAVPTINTLNEFGTTGQPTKAPVTTTSYAFTQTTTYPSVESYETTAIPINPASGLPVLGPNGQQQYNIDLPGFIQSQSPGTPIYGTGPGLVPGSLNQIINPGGQIQYTDSALPGLGQSFAQHTHPNNQYPGSNVINPGSPVVIPGSTTLVPGANPDLIQYSGVNSAPNEQLSDTAYQGIIPGQVLPEAGLPQNSQNYRNKNQPIVQYLDNQNKITPGSIIEENIYKPAQLNHDGISSTAPGFPSSVSAYASLNDDIINRPERPQAAADRNAVIINYENVRTPNGYFYSYDTSNGIHADETGSVGDGTRAQGSYSYIGDDGKLYSVTYTADENGFQPHGDHLPTPPPIPEAIKKVIEQAAKDEVAGIIDDGSYDEAKYGHDQYQSPLSYNHPEIKDSLDNNKIKAASRKTIKPIAGLSEDNYYKDKIQNHFTSDRANSQNIPTEHIGNVSHGFTKNIDNVDNNPLTGLNDIQKNKFGLKQQGTLATSPDTASKNEPNSHAYSVDDENIRGKDGIVSMRQPIISQVVNSESQIATDYPGLQIEDIKENYMYPDNEERLLPGSGTKLGQYDQSRLENPSNDFQSISDIQHLKQKPIDRRPEISNYKYAKDKRPQFDQIRDDDHFYTDNEQNNINQLPSRQENIQHTNDNGYHYNSPQNQFPTRFRGEQNYSTSRPIYKTLGKNTTLRPFTTSEVHNPPLDINRQNYNTQPFMTSSVTTPKDNNYTDDDYDDGEDYGNDQNTRRPSEHIDVSTRRRPQATYTTSRPQHTPFGQRLPSDQKETVLPRNTIDYSITPTYTLSTTTPIPPQNIIFGSTAIRRKPLPSRRPAISVEPGSSSYSVVPELKSSGNSDSTLPGLINKAQPSYGSRIPTGQRGSTLQTYPSTSTTIRPVTTSTNGYSDTTITPPSLNLAGPSYGSRIPSGQRVTTVIPTTLEYQPTLGATYPSGVPEVVRQPTVADNRNRYQYTTTLRPQIPERSGTKTFFPGISTRIYPTTSEASIYPSTTPIPSTQDRQGFLHGFGSTEPAPIDVYHSGYQYEPPKNVPSTGSLMHNGPLSTYVSQTAPSDYKYGTSEPIYSTTLSPSTIGTTSSSLLPSSTPGHQTQTFSTTQHPGYSSTKNIYDQTPLVDGFGRPIVSETQTRFSSPGHNVNQHPGIFITGGDDRRTPVALPIVSSSPGGIPTENVSSVYNVEPSSKHPGYFDQSKINGEDFSGPKQPQKFDPQTGYHYK